MSFLSMPPTPIVISTYSAGTVNSYNVPTPTHTDQAAVNGRLAQIAGTEVTQGQQETVADWLLILPPGTAIKARDQVKALGLVLEVVGPPYRAIGHDVEHHVEVKCRSVGG